MLVDFEVSGWSSQLADARTGASLGQVFLHSVECLPEVRAAICVASGAIEIEQASVPFALVSIGRFFGWRIVAERESIDDVLVGRRLCEFLVFEQAHTLDQLRHIGAKVIRRRNEIGHRGIAMIHFERLEDVPRDQSVEAGKHSQTERELRRGGSIMRVDQNEFWSNLAADISDIRMLELDDVFLESTILILADFAVLDLTRSVARLSESINDLLGGDESVAVTTGRCGMGSRDGVFVNDFEVWDDDVHLVWFGLVWFGCGARG